MIVFRRLEIRAIDSRSSAASTRMTKPPSVWPISCRPWTRWRRLRTSSRRRRGVIEEAEEVAAALRDDGEEPETEEPEIEESSPADDDDGWVHAEVHG